MKYWYSRSNGHASDIEANLTSVYFSLKRNWPFIEKKMFFHQQCFEISQVVLEKKMKMLKVYLNDNKDHDRELTYFYL